MIKFVYSCLDSKTGFMSPFLDDSDEVAIRGFSYSILNQPGIIGFSPADFNLYQIGSFNTETGELVARVPIRFVFSATNVFQKGVDSDAK